MINRIQNIRKGNDFEITDKVRVELSDEDEIKDAVNAFRDYISAQVLADEIIIVPSLDGQDCVDLEIYGLKAKARVTKN